MNKYKVLNESGLITSDEVAHAVNDIIEMDPAAQSTIDWLAGGLIELVAEPSPEQAPEPEPAPVDPGPEGATPEVATPEEAPVATAPFQIEVHYSPEATQEQIAACADWLKEIMDSLAKDESGIPSIVDAVTVRRVK